VSILYILTDKKSKHGYIVKRDFKPMPRIYDYNAFSSSKGGSNRGDFNFGFELKYVDIDIHNRPEEYEDIDDSKVFINYSLDLDVNSMGIEGFMFSVNSVELEFSVDDYPNETKEFDIDLIPGKTIDYSQIQIEKLDSILPTYPSQIEIDMNKSTDPRKFIITVYFGSNIS
jgi:hypothetical protein